MPSVPGHNGEGLIPPYEGTDATSRANRSPYRTAWAEVISRFATSETRTKILLGLVDYRDALRSKGVIDGFQWLTGSFVEQLSREPNDVDVVTFFHVPAGFNNSAARDLFDSKQMKLAYSCDAYPVVLSYPPAAGVPAPTVAASVVDHTAYWYGLFSHRRGTHAWKGFVQLALTPQADDAAARVTLLGVLAALQRKTS